MNGQHRARVCAPRSNVHLKPRHPPRVSGEVEAGPSETEGGTPVSDLPSVVVEAIEALPLANTPEVFGLHANAEIGYYTQAARDMWAHLLELQPQTGKVSPGATRVWSGPRGAAQRAAAGGLPKTQTLRVPQAHAQVPLSR